MRLLAWSFCLVALAACTTPDELCPPGTEPMESGRCADPSARYEPEQREDPNNVVAYGEPLQVLKLPDPPRSGFRVVAPPITLEPGEELETCLSWPYPSIKNTLVYAARVHATPGLHHSNVIAKPVNDETGPNPYPECHPGADDAFSDVPAVIPDVLFASSTQVSGREELVLAPGLAFRVDPTREISTNYHLLNYGSAPARVEVAYDFFTMPDELLVNEVAPFVMQVNDFLIPPQAKLEVGGTCRVFGGEIVSIMPHTHQFSERFVTDIVPPEAEGEPRNVYEDSGFDTDSDIVTYDPPLSLGEYDSLRYSCLFHNTTDHDITYGIGDNEMCVLFGYLYPVEKQVVAYSPFQGEPCQSFQIGLFR
jgi:Copper type II ascorbate-dependent monooxygenase, C-terminal domain